MTSTEDSSDTLVAVSRVLSKLLRHEPGLVGVRLDANGWADVEQLLSSLHRAKHALGAPKRLRSLPDITHDLLREVVAKNDKGRFTFSHDERRIRAVQGHSVTVDLGYTTLEPPEVLFHGTTAENWSSIKEEGLVRGSRHAVHLSSDPVTATRVGARHGRPVVLLVQAGQLHRDGHKFSRAENGVWLVESVPARYLMLHKSG
jgi:putative RNA 2'-phosphotransferase